MLLNKKLFTEKQEAQIINKIAEVERITSGEIRLFVEKECDLPSPMDRVKELFYESKMGNTSHRTGVLIYLAYKSHHFAIWGDQSITEALPNHFWDDIVKETIEQLKQNLYTEGIIMAIEKIGIHLMKKFPSTQNNINQLPDDIIYG